MRTRGRALESGQIRRLEPPLGGLLLRLGGSHWRLVSRPGLLRKGSSVMMAPPLGLWARHMVHLMAEGQFSNVQYSQAHLVPSSVIVAPTLGEAAAGRGSAPQLHSRRSHRQAGCFSCVDTPLSSTTKPFSSLSPVLSTRAFPKKPNPYVPKSIFYLVRSLIFTFPCSETYAIVQQPPPSLPPSLCRLSGALNHFNPHFQQPFCWYLMAA